MCITDERWDSTVGSVERESLSGVKVLFFASPPISQIQLQCRFPLMNVSQVVRWYDMVIQLSPLLECVEEVTMMDNE